MFAVLGLYEPAILLGTIVLIYGVAAVLSPKDRRIILWYLVALILSVGAAGVAYQLVSGRPIYFPAASG